MSWLCTPVARIALQSNKRWLSLICLVGLLLAASACTPSDIQVDHPTLIATSSPLTRLPTPMLEQWPSPEKIAVVRIEQSGDTSTVAFYLVDRDYHDTIGSGLARLRISGQVREGFSQDCLQVEENSDYPCVLVTAEELVSREDFHAKTWEEMDCAEARNLEGDLLVKIPGCVGDHFTYQFEPLAAGKPAVLSSIVVKLLVQLDVRGNVLEEERLFVWNDHFEPVLKEME
jgi:hypothetical protein